MIEIFKILSKGDKYRQMIQKATNRTMLFPNMDNQEKKSTDTLECKIKLPSQHPFRSSQQIENNMQITHQSSQQYPTSLHNNWPQSCIGLVLCQYHENNQIYYVYGTGILIHRNIVLTSAQNVYCCRLNRQYTNIRFIVGICGDRCSGIYDAMRVHYPKEYIMQEEHENYNFAVLQLYDDLTKNFGYVGWKIFRNINEDEKYTIYGYISGNQQGFFTLRQIRKHEKQFQDQDRYLENGILVKENENKHYIVGLKHIESIDFLSEKIRNKINYWTQQTQINLDEHNIGPQGCKYLSQASLIYLNTINLKGNNIGALGCKYLSQANWTYLTSINLNKNNIGAQGCKYLSYANWIHLKIIHLYNNGIGVYGCKYLSQANWTYLTTINLYDNNIGAQGCKYLSQTNWTYLTTINLYCNSINAQGCKYLREVSWTHLKQNYLYNNNIGAQGCKYLNQSNWTHLTQIDLQSNNINDIIYRLLLQQSYPSTTIYIS